MGLTEGHAPLHQVIRQVCGQHGIVQRRPHRPLVDLERLDHARHDGQQHAYRVQGVEKGLLVLLQVLVIGGGKALGHHEHTGNVAHQASRLAPHQLHAVGVALLGHDARPRRVALVEEHKAELGAGPDDQVLGQAAEVQAQERPPAQRLQDHIPVAHGVHTVLADAQETQILR